MLQELLPKMMDPEKIVEVTRNFTFAQIKGLVYDAQLESLSNQTDFTVESIVGLAQRRNIPEPGKKKPQVGQKATFA